ncbi:ASCH domain-containing protein [Gossypium australe]|uniref:ASCH domain-containing protein n=1 Tax=Gossypium australe TaxID=47621 RepID=A0A5B6VNS3_9ROSI|nr:ASCH domain-containing protein [Gossypium australe]
MEQPSSPGTNPVELSNSIEELLKFTLQSHLNGTLELDIGLSKQFCSSLLNHPSTSPISPNASSSSEASQNPLYKQLARALYEIITFGSLQESSDCNKVASFCQGSDLKQKDEWFDLVHKEGSELAEILKNINFELHVQEPFFTMLKDGIKAVEGRCAVGDYNRIATGALILFNKCLVLEVQDVHYYASFFEMLEAESLAKVLPGVKTIDEGVQVYRKFYTEEKEKTNGVAAICVAKMAAQPYLSLARILSVS